MSDRFLRKDDGGVFIWSEVLAKRSDMVDCDSEGRRIFAEGESPAKEEETEMDIDGKILSIPNHIVPIIEKLLVKAIGLDPTIAEEQRDQLRKKLNDAANENGDLRKAKLSMDSIVSKLQEDNSKAIKEIGELKKDRDRLAQKDTDNKREIDQLKREIKSLK